MTQSKSYDYSVEVAVVGAGACGYCAGLAAQEHGAEVLVLERDAQALGTTAMSTGLVPGAGTRFQRERGIEDSPELFRDDIMGKTKGETDGEVALAIAEESGRTVEWLADNHGVPFSLVDSFLYPGHSVMRMHGTPNRTGEELMGALSAAGDRSELQVLTQARVAELYADGDGRVSGLRIERPDGGSEDLGCGAVVLACCGFAGNAAMVEEFIPEIATGEFFGHPGNKGDGIRWGQALGGAVADMHAYQGHGGLAAGRGVPILWPVVMTGGVQVNVHGRRFSDESRGYSEQAVDVLAQPGHVAWTVYDDLRHQKMMEFKDYHDAIEANAVVHADSVAGLAERCGIDGGGLSRTLTDVAGYVADSGTDEFGRKFGEYPPLSAPYCAVKVTGALFHTQGGLVVDGVGRVVTSAGKPLPNLFAGGGVARGISGPSCWGYMAGNGLVTATAFGRLAGYAAADLAQS